MTMKGQVVMHLFTAEERRAGMHKAHFRALQAVLVLLGVVALSGVWFGPGRADAAVAGKTYDLWVSVGPGQSPPPLHTCARFTTTTIQVDVCGAQAGAMVEQSYTNPPDTGTFWVGEVPCGGLDLSFLGLAYDGLTLGYQANVLSAVASSGQGHLTAGVEGVENPACQ
jgi:hypothetical protein